jgi:hypothetical protein
MSSAAPAKSFPFYKHFLRALAVTFFTLLLFPRVFLENDDLGFIYLLSHGFYAPWVSKPFCWLLLQLYSLFPGLGWYGVLHYLILTLDLGVLFKLVNDWADQNGLSMKASRWLSVAVILLFYPFIMRITFTCTSILSAGLGLIGLLAYFRRLPPQKPTASQLISTALGFGAIFSLGYLVRPEGLGAMVFLWPVALYGLWVSRKTIFSRRTLLMGFVFLLPLLAGLTLDKSVLRYPAAQVPYLSYVVESNDAFGFGYTEQFKTHPEWLASTGWSRSDYGMFERFLYWDETIFSQAKITRLIANSPTALASRLMDLANPKILFARLLKTLAKTWLSNFPFTVYCLGVFILFSLMGTSRLSRWFPGIMLAMVFIDSTLMQYVLRFPYRVAYPLITICALSLLALPGFSAFQLQKQTGGLKASAKSVLLFSALFLLLFNGPIRLVKTWSTPLAQTREKLASLNTIQAQHYILREAGVIQISAADPLDATPLAYPDIGPGWLIHSPPFYQRLRQFGMDRGSQLIPASYNNPQILYFFKDKNLPVLQNYIKQHYHQTVRFIPADTLLHATFHGNSHLYRLVTRPNATPFPGAEETL